MNADTLKLFALSDIIQGLRKQMTPLEPWSPQAEKLPTQLMTARLDDVWRVGPASEEAWWSGTDLT
jgi:hypothetical protein